MSDPQSLVFRRKHPEAARMSDQLPVVVQQAEIEKRFTQHLSVGGTGNGSRRQLIAKLPLFHPPLARVGTRSVLVFLLRA